MANIEELIEDQKAMKNLQIELMQTLSVLLQNQNIAVDQEKLVINNQSVIINNQQIIVDNQAKIISNQNSIVQNQLTLSIILELQKRLLSSVSAIAGSPLSTLELEHLIKDIAENFDKNQKILQDPQRI